MGQPWRSEKKILRTSLEGFKAERGCPVTALLSAEIIIAKFSAKR